MFKEKVHNNIKKYNLAKKGDIIVVGVSGGADSIALLNVLLELKSEIQVSLQAVHVNHLLRGSESDEDEDFVKCFCKERNINFKVAKIDIKTLAQKKGQGIEEAAREERYKVFQQVAADVGATKIAVAHNENDQVETVLMNIMRGSGLDGLCGMKFARGNIIRPLLNISRSEVEDYCRTLNLNPRTDSSNMESYYTRNRVRLKLIPYLNEIFGVNIASNVIRLTHIISEENDFLEGYYKTIFDKIVIINDKNHITLDVNEFNILHGAVKKRIARYIIKSLKGNLVGIENINIQQTINLALSGSNGSSINLPSEIIVSKSYNLLRFRKGCDIKQEKVCERVINIPDEIYVENYGKLLITLEAVENIDEGLFKRISKGYEQHFDFDKIKGDLVLRSRKDGDRINLFEGKGSKKLKEYFINNKVEREERDKIPLIACGSEILWAVGHVVTSMYKVTNETKRVLRIKFIKK